MARQIKKRCEERVNLYTVEDKPQLFGRNISPEIKDNTLMDEKEMD